MGLLPHIHQDDTKGRHVSVLAAMAQPSTLPWPAALSWCTYELSPTSLHSPGFLLAPGPAGRIISLLPHPGGSKLLGKVFMGKIDFS